MINPNTKNQKLGCSKHNQTDDINQNICQMCSQEISGMMSNQKHLEKQQEILNQQNEEFNHNIQIFESLIDSLVFLKENIVLSIENIIQTIYQSIKNIQKSQQSLWLQFQKDNVTQNEIEVLQMKILNNQQYNKEVKAKMRQQIKEVQQKLINIDYILQQLNDNSNEQQNDNINDIQELKINETENKGKFQYELILQPRRKEEQWCRAFAFNNNNNILFVALGKEIIIYEFLDGRIAKELQRLIDHNLNIYCLHFMRQSNQYVSGSEDQSIIIWNLDNQNRWMIKQRLTEHKGKISCVLMNQNEDLLISGSGDSTVRFWNVQNDNWICSQELKMTESVLDISLSCNESKLIACECNIYTYNPNIEIMEIQNNKSWAVVQKIMIEERGFRLCFTIEDQFVFQPEKSNCLLVYDFDKNIKEYVKSKQVQIDTDNSFSCYQQFHCQYLREQNILAVKHGEFLNIFKVNDRNNYELLQSINFYEFRLYGRLFNDGQYMVTWDRSSEKLQVRKLKYI